MAEFLVALADFDRQRAWADLGHSSLFWFLHRELGLSKGAAYYRKVAAELLQRHPEMVEPLRDGRLCITSITELGKVITRENVAEILPRFFHLSRREAAEVAAALRPVERPPMRDVVSALATSPPVAVPAAAPRDNSVAVQPHEPLLRVIPPTTSLTVPLTEDLRRLHVTVSRRLLAKLDAARDALSHSHPGATTESILEAGLDLLLARHRERRGLGAKPARKSRSAAPGRIRAEAKREVWTRDDGKCQWALDGGGLCGSTVRLEFDHVIPRGLGGTSEPSNLRLLCRFHNQYVARQVYGDALMDRHARGRFAKGVSGVSEPAATYASPPSSPTPPLLPPPEELRDHPLLADPGKRHRHLGLRSRAVTAANQPLPEARVCHPVTGSEGRARPLGALVEGIVDCGGGRARSCRRPRRRLLFVLDDGIARHRSRMTADHRRGGDRPSGAGRL